MRRSFTSLGVLLCGLILISGCAAKRCGPCAGDCKRKCKTPCKTPCATDAKDWTHFGGKLKLAADKTICAGKVLANKDKYAGKHIRVCGKVDSVCAHKGCWIRLAGAGGDETLFVKFTCPVEGRLIPMEAASKCAVVEGTFEVKEISQEEARHYKEDAGASPEEIAKIVGPQKQVKLNAPAAMIAGLGAPAESTK